MLLSFVQLEFTHAIGVPLGTYVVGDGRSRDTLITAIRKDGSASLALATHIHAARPIDRAAGDALLRDPALEAHVTAALEVLNRAIRAARTAVGDPYIIEATRADPRTVRVGYGSADEIAAGTWQAAQTLDGPRPGRTKRLVKLQVERAVADALAGSERLFEAEDIALRALLDLAHGRRRAAAALARAAWEVLRSELGESDRSAPALDPQDVDAIEAVIQHVLETAAAHRRVEEGSRSSGSSVLPSA